MAQYGLRNFNIVLKGSGGAQRNMRASDVSASPSATTSAIPTLAPFTPTMSPSLPWDWDRNGNAPQPTLQAQPRPYPKGTTSVNFDATTANPSACYTDLDCQHIDEQMSSPDNIVYMCPTATCAGGKCACGSACVADPYSGSCCQDIYYQGTTSVCVNLTSPPSSSSSALGSSAYVRRK